MIPQIKSIEKLQKGTGGNGRIARIEKAVDAILQFLGNLAEGEGISFRVSRDKSSIAIHADLKDLQNILPIGAYDNQVLKWNAKEGRWEAGWVTAVDPNATPQPSDFVDGQESEITS